MSVFHCLGPVYFSQIADQILNKTGLWINGQIYRILEIEFYLHSPNHPDGYVHKNPEQQISYGWYFHRFGNGTYKNGTFKGLDITLGSPGVYFSILIRTIGTPSLVIEGPCKTVDHVLEQMNVQNIYQMTGGICCSCIGGPLCLISYNWVQEQIWTGSRVGLSTKHLEFKEKDYRFLIMKHLIRKQKTGLRPIQ